MNQNQPNDDFDGSTHPVPPEYEETTTDEEFKYDFNSIIDQGVFEDVSPGFLKKERQSKSLKFDASNIPPNEE